MARMNTNYLTFFFAMEEVSQDPRLFPNATLGYNVYENYFHPRITYDAMLDLLSPGQRSIPNYRCGRQKEPLAVLEGANSEISGHVSNILSIYKIPQVSYDVTSRDSEHNALFPFFYRMVPKEEILYPGIVQLLQHFGWTWIGLFAPDNDNGERFMRILKPLLTSHGICVAISQSLPEMNVPKVTLTTGFHFLWRQVKVFIFYGEKRSISSGLFLLKRLLEHLLDSTVGKVWITTVLWDLSVLFSMDASESRQGHWFFSFAIQMKRRPKYEQVNEKHLFSYEVEFFDCTYSKHELSVKGRGRCKQKGDMPLNVLEYSLTPESYSIYHSALAVAYAVHAAMSSTSKNMRRCRRADNLDLPELHPWQVSPFFLIHPMFAQNYRRNLRILTSREGQKT
ncbi:vomeronasal type-2 receptor 26 isoform X2 [Anolis carolinensis]|uniref:vomeronasal type-2 receptor 26 isoform X2 n=1 Tax=Anolis carolinensis TaxID=28377 RepID=UPI002F2B6304